MEPFLGQIQIFGFNFNPRGWAFCNGQLLPIAQNQALFSLLGTIYGGDGRTTFALPELRGRLMVHKGQGPGLPDFRQGQKSGAERVTLTTGNLPSHNHNLQILAADGPPASDAIDQHYVTNQNDDAYATSRGGSEYYPLGATGNAGNAQAFDIRMPSLATTVCIALVGLFPSRN